jgi:phosphoserine phosphatase
LANAVALFDLDHTLIPFDSGMAWTRFLAERGVVSTDAEERYLVYCHQYVAGTLDIHAMHRASLAPLLSCPRATLALWQREFEREMAPRVPRSALDLVSRHQRAGHLTKAAFVDPSPDAALTGEIDGEPCYREHKVTRVNQWLALQPPGAPRSLAGFERSWFYSDSMSDLPLLRAVSDPVAVRPDERLRAHALAAGWTVLELEPE